MIGRRYWILIWYGILVIGVVGLLVAVYWGRRARWTNLDEVLRALGTILVSVGMLLLLYRVADLFAQILLVASLFAFVGAFALGRKRFADRSDAERRREEDEAE